MIAARMARIKGYVGDKTHFKPSFRVKPLQLPIVRLIFDLTQREYIL